MMRVNLVCWPDLHGLSRGKVGDCEEHEEQGRDDLDQALGDHGEHGGGPGGGVSGWSPPPEAGEDRG